VTDLPIYFFGLVVCAYVYPYVVNYFNIKKKRNSKEQNEYFRYLNFQCYRIHLKLTNRKVEQQGEFSAFVLIPLLCFSLSSTLFRTAIALSLELELLLKIFKKQHIKLLLTIYLLLKLLFLHEFEDYLMMICIYLFFRDYIPKFAKGNLTIGETRIISQGLTLLLNQSFFIQNGIYFSSITHFNIILQVTIKFFKNILFA
jgi:hypothetical protein